MKKSYARELQNLDAAGLLRTETPVVINDNMEVRLHGANYALNFIGTDALGWGSNPVIRDTVKAAALQYGTGSTASRFTVGSADIHLSLESKLSEFLELDDCIAFPTMYSATIGLFESLTGERDSIFIDEMCNPGLFDGARLSSASIIPYKHRDNDDLEYQLKCSQNSRFRVIASDAVFNANGDMADLVQIENLKQTYDAVSIIDDSLGLGLLGSKGKGSYNHIHAGKKADLICGSFNHALGNVGGGFIGGSRELVKWIRNTSRAYIVSEPLSPINAAVVLKALEILDSDPAIIERLYANASYARTKMIKKAWIPMHNEYPFISIKIGSTLRTQKMVEYLYERHILISGLCYPNTPEGAALLRINISANHSESQIDTLVDTLEEAFRATKNT